MARWPDVPAVFGWLSLDRRGRWLLKGETLSNQAALAFIARNYAPDDRGRWYFQNGPQRVYVALQGAPLALRLEPGGDFSDHRGEPAGDPRVVLMDENGDVWMDTALGPGLLDDRDLDAYSQRLCGRGGEPLGEDVLIERLDTLCAGGGVDLWVREGDALLPLVGITSAGVPGRLGFVRDPQP